MRFVVDPDRRWGTLLVSCTALVTQQEQLNVQQWRRRSAPFGLLTGTVFPEPKKLADEDHNSGKRRKRHHWQPLPQSLAPWHTLPYMGREVQHLAVAVRHKVAGTVTNARRSWRKHRTAAKARKASLQHGSSLHLRLPWRRSRRERRERERQKREDPTKQQLAEEAVRRGFELQNALDIRGAIQAFEEAVRLVPGNAHYLSCLSKQWSDITFIPGTPSAEAKACAEKGVVFAGQALEADPQHALAHVAACVSKGRLTFFVDNRTKAELAAASRKDAMAALEADPECDLAHHLLGRWHTEMAQLNFMVRALIRMIYGATLAPGSHPEALAAYQRAVDLAPGRLIHRVELARTALRLGQTSRAVRELQIAVDLEVEDINAHLTRLDGVKMLEALRRKGRVSDLLRPAVPIDDRQALPASDGGVLSPAAGTPGP